MPEIIDITGWKVVDFDIVYDKSTTKPDTWDVPTNTVYGLILENPETGDRVKLEEGNYEFTNKIIPV